MKQIRVFDEHQRAIVVAPAGSRLLTGIGGLRQAIAPSVVVEASVEVQDDQSNRWYRGSTGLVPAEDVVLIPQMMTRRPLPQPQQARVVVPGGTWATDPNQQTARHWSLKAVLTVVATATSTVGDVFETVDHQFVASEDVWLTGTPMQFEIIRAVSQTVQVIASVPEPVLDDQLQLVTTQPPFAMVAVEAELVDRLGDHYWRLKTGELMAKANTVVVVTDLGLDTTAPILKLGAENINQNFWGMPNGCEPAALLEGLHLEAQAATLSYGDFLQQMPISADYNPYHGFGGDPATSVHGRFEAIFPTPLSRWASRYATVRDLSGSTVSQLKQVVSQKNPVVAYVTVGFKTPEWAVYSFGKAVTNNHAVLIDGWFDQLIHVSDPIDGPYWLPVYRFAAAYNARYWAVGIMESTLTDA
ncbi:C39 family peptidase [uncultured Secundilactobacillus sp.]|uniref:C39 family peptidase n=1 Tax=uncultured Secundilactobacillus sp. TaxID=2813935 RepID=UPI00258AD78A|nr:C39 family peptidase [uncultured Secundilactobacillus sp.]